MGKCLEFGRNGAGWKNPKYLVSRASTQYGNIFIFRVNFRLLLLEIYILTCLKRTYEISSIFTQGKQKKKRVLKYQKLSKHIPQLISAALRCEPFSEKTLKKSTCAVMIRIIITQGNQIFLYSWISVSGTPDKWNFY